MKNDRNHVNDEIRTPSWMRLACLAVVLLSGACTGSDGSDGTDGQDAAQPLTPDELTPSENSPGVVATVLGLSGATGAGGNFQVGDRISVTFQVAKDDGTDWRAEELDLGRILVSGPTVNYQRVLAEKQDLITAAIKNADGSFTYTFADPIPAQYLVPLNDSSSFGPLDGELAGDDLLSGTYTVGLYVGWNYTVDDQSFRDIGDATADFLLGDALTIAPREVVKLGNCNQCHTSLRAHGGSRRNVAICVLCHTAGAEDRNVASAAGGTPGVSIEFSTMIHKIHDGAHLPSVLGVASNPDGSRNRAATPKPYQIVGNQNRVNDFSAVGFPVWPNLTSPLPRDEGYSALTSGEKALEDTIRSGASSCFVCHDDPDGSGPLTAPTQGGIAFSQPSRNACGACHDDVDFGHLYTSNGSTMPAQNDDSACTFCHSPSGDSLAVSNAHKHPLLDPSFNPGLVFGLSNVLEAGTNDDDGTFDPGEKVAFRLTVQDDEGASVDPAGLAGLTLVFAGPTSNSNLVHYVDFPRAALTGSQPFDVLVPERLLFECVGEATSAADEFATGRSPHWNVASATTDVNVATLAVGGGSSTLSAAVSGRQNYVDVIDPTGFARDDFVILERGVPGSEECLKVQFVEGNRLWFSAPTGTTYPIGPRAIHTLGAPVEEVTLALKASGTDYTLDAATGTIDELLSFGDGNTVVVSYTTDFVVPDVYPVAINGAPDLGEAAGVWNGKSLVDGTYALTVYGSKALTLTLQGESNSYRAANSTAVDVLVGGATAPEPYDKIASAQSCYACHQQLSFHGGGRGGFEACIACHGTAGSADRPQYVAANAPATTGLTINFRTMLHKIHMGEELANASAYTVVGFGSSAYPNNFGLTTFAEVAFPAMPSGPMDCAVCHGTSESWKEPVARNHPTEQVQPTLVWSATCGSCHDSDSTQAHIEIMTSGSGHESCATCHSSEDELSPELVHKVR